MATNKAEVIFHPIRMRIIQALVRGDLMTTQQLQERLQDVPQATLYRHLKKLVEAGVLVIAEEIPNRGTVEKVYRLPEMGAEISREELEQASEEDHLTYFVKFAINLIGEYGRYLQSGNIDLYRDGVSYRQYSAWLTEEENLQVLREIKEILVKAAQNKPEGNRRRRLIAVTAFPEI